MMRESGWLIESYYKSATQKPMWLRLFAYNTVTNAEQGPKPEWTEDSLCALRFGRESDAAWFALLYPSLCCLAKITEHVWVDGGEATDAQL